MRVLLIEDDAETASYVAQGLRDDGHLVDHEADGRTGLFLATEQTHDLMIVDRMLPRLDGLSVVKALRAVGINIPVLYLTTMSGIDENRRSASQSRSRTRFESPSASRRAMPQRGSWLPSLCSTYSPRPPSSAHSCASWMTLSGSTPSRWRHSDSSRGAWWRSRWR